MIDAKRERQRDDRCQKRCQHEFVQRMMISIDRADQYQGESDEERQLESQRIKKIGVINEKSDKDETQTLKEKE